jgi:8-oxo-dGTP pyrophosphatase MutT (NUDIX family)
MSMLERLAGSLAGSERAPVPPGDGARRAAVAVVLHEDPAGGVRALLMKRAERAGDPWSGHISLPGGGYHPDDPDLLATAIRETREELGLELDPAQLVGSLRALAPRLSGPTGLEVTPFVFRADTAPVTVCGPEAVCAFWLPLDRAAAGAFDARYTYPGSTLVFPAWQFEGYTIWGLTRRILDDVLVAAR